jgi:hypothetical protein
MSFPSKDFGGLTAASRYKLLHVSETLKMLPILRFTQAGSLLGGETPPFCANRWLPLQHVLEHVRDFFESEILLFLTAISFRSADTK